MLEAPLELHYKRFRLNDDEFFDLCSENDELKFERDSNGNIYTIPYSSGQIGQINAILTAELVIWNKLVKFGIVFSSSTSFILPNTSVRSPNASFISKEKWNTLTEKDKKKFPPLCPDFVVELMSESDNEADAKKKMTDEWIANGCKLVWLINPFEQKVFIYRQNGEIQIINGFENVLTGEDVLPNFELDLRILVEDF